MSQVGIYFTTWDSKWVSTFEEMDLAKFEAPVTIVNLSFVDPGCTYTRGQQTFGGTGLQFPESSGYYFQKVKQAIGIIRRKGIKVMLAVGGGAYWSSPKKFNGPNIVALMNDLYCDGIDIDWEHGYSEAHVLTDVIKNLKPLMGQKKISFAGFSTGANPNSGQAWDKYSGMNIDALQNQGHNVDWVNVMLYDAGEGFDGRKANEHYLNYRKYYSGPLLYGFEVGRHGWGGEILYKNEAEAAIKFVADQGLKNGIFIWSDKKDGSPGVSTSEILQLASTHFVKPSPVPDPPAPTVPDTIKTVKAAFVFKCVCPNCGFHLENTLPK